MAEARRRDVVAMEEMKREMDQCTTAKAALENECASRLAEREGLEREMRDKNEALSGELRQIDDQFQGMKQELGAKMAKLIQEREALLHENKKLALQAAAFKESAQGWEAEAVSAIEDRTSLEHQMEKARERAACQFHAMRSEKSSLREDLTQKLMTLSVKLDAAEQRNTRLEAEAAANLQASQHWKAHAAAATVQNSLLQNALDSNSNNGAQSASEEPGLASFFVPSEQPSVSASVSSSGNAPGFPRGTALQGARRLSSVMRALRRNSMDGKTAVDRRGAVGRMKAVSLVKAILGALRQLRAVSVLKQWFPRSEIIGNVADGLLLVRRVAHSRLSPTHLRGIARPRRPSATPPTPASPPPCHCKSQSCARCTEQRAWHIPTGDSMSPTSCR
eukprot:TRINITY_DN8410_c0_g1_i4.p1 TRINITY_DN8410_c0_g1~~TRINITY_DN8410_c0_g1_i4.p1  ORF type:complete len:392 (+),score=112.49 TRINITY_DN8410_c0_g1_i4:3-1178(+)